MARYKPEYHQDFKMETKIKLKEGNTGMSSYEGLTGTIIGISSINVFFTYIILLDKACLWEGDLLRAITVPGQCLEVL